jgi:hypothetical protein
MRLFELWLRLGFLRESEEREKESGSGRAGKSGKKRDRSGKEE